MRNLIPIRKGKTVKKTFIIITSAVSLLLSGCGESDPCTTASNPSECRAWGDAGGDINDYLIGRDGRIHARQSRWTDGHHS